MKSQVQVKSMLPVLLTAFLAACGGGSGEVSSSGSVTPTTLGSTTSLGGGPDTTGGSGEVSSSDAGVATSSGPTTSLASGPSTTVEAGPPTTSSNSVFADPCGLLTHEELEETTGFALADGILSDLTAHGIDGSSCFFEGGSAANVSVTIVIGPQAAVLFDSGLAEGGETIDGIGDQAYLVSGDLQSNVYVLQDDVVVAVDIVHASEAPPDDLGQRMTDLAETAAGRI